LKNNLAKMMKWLFIQANSRCINKKHFNGEQKINIIKDDISIIRDKWNIPHITAKSKTDLFFAQGFVHAQDRLWQLEMSRRIGMGRLAEAFGEVALETDRLTRTLGFYNTAKKDIKLISEDKLEYLNSFAEGVNYYIDNYPKPVEFLLTRIKPEPWKPIHTIVWGRIMSWTLSHGWSGSLTRQEIIDKVGMEKAEELNIIYPEDNPVELPDGLEFNKLGLDNMYESVIGPYLMKDMEGGGRGSNAWAISANKSETGGAILCNDTHLAIQIPSVWYLNHLKADDYHVTGATLPGFPGMILGHNENISIGITLSFSDNEDIFIEKISDTDKNKYHYENDLLSIEVRDEIIKVKNKPDFIEKVKSTIHGPLIGDVTNRQNLNISLSSKALKPNTMFNGLLDLNTAKNWDDFVDACQKLDAPPLNFVYADTENNIGLWVTGEVPIRNSGEGQLPVPGWNKKGDWIDSIPSHQMPHLLNPKSGYVISCNNKIIDDNYPYFLSNSYMNGYRAKRIKEVFDSKEKISISDCKKLHTDFKSIPGLLILEGLLKNFQTAKPKASKVLSEIINWDGYLNKETTGGTVYQVFIYKLLRNIVEPQLGIKLTEKYLGVGEHPLLLPTSELLGHSVPALIRIIQDGGSKWIKDSNELISIIEKTLISTCIWLESNLGYNPEEWIWGKIHTATFQHGLTIGQEFLSLIFNLGPFQIGGDTDTVCQTAFNPNSPYENTAWSPAIRLIIDLKNFDESNVILPPGQSGVLGSTHYQDMVEPWLKGDYIPLAWSDKKVQELKKHELTFKPNPE